MKKFLKLLLIAYLGGTAGCVTLLVLSGLWERGGHLCEALPAAFILHVTWGLPWFVGTVVSVFVFWRSESK